MKYLISTLLLVFAISGNAQNTPMSKWKIGANYSLDATLRDGFNPYGSNGILPGGCYEPLPNSSFNKMSFTSGITTQYSLNRLVDFGTGVSFSRKKQSTYYYICALNEDFAATYIYPWCTTRDYLEIPVFARFNFLDSKFGIHSEIGMTTSYAIKADFMNPERFLISAQGGTGLNYTFGSILNLGLTAYYKRKLTNFNRLSDLDFKNSLSLELRLLYNL